VFKITAIKPGTTDSIILNYDPHTSSLTDEAGRELVDGIHTSSGYQAVVTTSRETPAGKVTPRLLKISLGLSCNYECDYCSQRFVPRASETNKNDIDPFLAGLDDWVTSSPEKVEFWGGEPFVYWKTLKPLAEAIRAKYPQAVLSVITNGSLLTPEINDWLLDLGFSVGISHDGPGQPVRGPDPLTDPAVRPAILDLYRRLAPLGRISFNAMLSRENSSRAAINQFFVDLTGDANVNIGEGTFVDAYDQGGVGASLRTGEHLNYRNQAFAELRTGLAKNFDVGHSKIQGLMESLKMRRPSSALGQKCGMDRADAIAVDLKGQVMTCQNVSSKGAAPNGESHLIGTVADLAGVKLKTSTHWSHRAECKTCPVLQICAGACMFLEGDLWETTCNNAYSDNIVFFAAAIEFLTDYVPVYVEGTLRESRKDIFGLVHGTPKESARRVIPIVAAPVSAKS
jgi:uncharacterized protein